MCDIYFNGTHPCLGGVLALNGVDGKEIWRHYTQHEVFALNCGYDLDKDGVMDCLAAGRVSVTCKKCSNFCRGYCFASQFLGWVELILRLPNHTVVMY